MARVYVTVQGEMIDAICRKIYGEESGHVENLVSANPGLADAPYVLPLGTKITLPDLDRGDEVGSIVALWN